ncbi:MAG TPA: hypothetical protein VJ932_05650, partial [Alkalispirochaeta sp.]|nr:hypothetical protein [Alkalispirochaeta sp.]
GAVVSVRGRVRAIRSTHRTAPAALRTERVSVAGRRFFLVTDGFIDQGGGERGRAYGTRRLYEFFRNFGTSHHRDWERELDAYRGNAPQRDDILAITWECQEAFAT